MNGYESCADLCDDRGFNRQAALLRAVGRRGLRVHAVCERVRADGEFLEEFGGVPRALFLDREDAERDARRREVLALRERNLYEYSEGDLYYLTIEGLDAFEREVSAILGTDYQLPDSDTHKGPLFPADATDDEVLAIAHLFRIPFFYVADLELVDGANPLGPCGVCVMIDDLVCSDLCEENGYARQAELLRAIAGAGDGRTVYVVMERGAEYNDEIMDPKPGGDPTTAFLDRAEAERAAADRNARWHRENNILDYCYDLKDVTTCTAAGLSWRISEVLGRPYELPNEGEPTFARMEGPLVPEPVTDEQMRKIADLFTLKFYYVVEAHFAGPGDGLLREEVES